jgi:aldehyde:ferredoxin oxidoreductase
VGAKSPLTNGFGNAEVGGYWGAELKQAGYDAIIIEGKSEIPVYLWINDGKVEIRGAKDLWGKTTGECQKLIQEELGDSLIRIAQIGPAAEKLVRYSSILFDLSHAAGRTGLGAVMGSKNLKAIAVRGHQKVALSDAAAVNSLAKRFRDSLKTHPYARSLRENGTVAELMMFNQLGALPTRNFRQGVFEGADKISAEAVKSSILVRRKGCYACPVHCKPVIATGEPYNIDPTYGGSEFETIASLGSNCGIDNLEAVCKGGELCNAYGLDTISTGGNIAFAMECFEQGILTEKDTGGLKLNFGNAQAMVQLVGMIAEREGIGGVLAEGVARASQVFGKGAEDFALHIKGQELPMHEPRFKPGMGVGYAISPTGADHCHNVHDVAFIRRVPAQWRALGIIEPLPWQDLSPAKVRMITYGSLWHHVLNCLVFCMFIPSDPQRIADLVRAVTGWNTTVWELMKVGERCINMARAFNIREGKSKEDDCLPRRFFTPFSSGPLEGVSIDKGELDKAIETYYAIVGWDKNGVPTSGKLQELGIEWVDEHISR